MKAGQTSLEKPGALDFGSNSDWIVSCQLDFSDNFSFNQSIVDIESRHACALLVCRCDVAPASGVYSVNKRRSQPTTSASDKSHEQLSSANHPDLHSLSLGVIINKWSRLLGVHPQRYCNGFHCVQCTVVRELYIAVRAAEELIGGSWFPVGSPSWSNAAEGGRRVFTSTHISAFSEDVQRVDSDRIVGCCQYGEKRFTRDY